MELTMKIIEWALIVASISVCATGTEDVPSESIQIETNADVLEDPARTQRSLNITGLDVPQRKVKAKYEVFKKHGSDKSSEVSKEDLQKESTRYREPARSPPLPVLSSTEDFTLNNPEVDDRGGPVAYETIVYDPHSKDASAAFSRSQIWDTPELVIRDTVQRQEGKNLFHESSSHTEYTPGIERSAQTPLGQIRYRGQQQKSPRHSAQNSPYTRPQNLPPPPPTRPLYEKNSVDELKDEDEEETRLQELNDEGESQGVQDDDAEAEDEEEPKRKYPTRLQEESFNPFSAVGEPEDIYSDVLSNIGSVFSDDDSPIHNEARGFSGGNIGAKPHGYQGLAPQFERYNFENLKGQDRADEDSDGTNEELEEENEEFSDDVEEGGLETKNVEKTKVIPSVTPQASSHHSKKPANFVGHKEGERFRSSPFPSVKIVKHGQTPQNQAQLSPQPTPQSFSPWLPGNRAIQSSPTHSWQQLKPRAQESHPKQHWQQTKKSPPVWSKPQEFGPSQNRAASTLKNHNLDSKQKSTKEKKEGQTWDHADEQSTHSKSGPDENDPSKPYHESYSKSYQKSWKESSPKKKEQNSYSKSWHEDKPVRKYKTEHSTLESDSSEIREFSTNAPGLSFQSKPSKKVTRESHYEVEEEEGEDRRNSSNETQKQSSNDNENSIAAIAATSQKLTNTSAVHDIDALYSKQSDNV